MKTEYTIVAYISPDRSNTPICLYYCESWSSAYGINSLIACSRPALHMCRWNIYAANSNNVGSWNSVVRNKTTSGPRTLFFGRQSLDGAGVVTGSRRGIKCRTPAINCTPERRLMSIYRPHNTPTPAWSQASLYPSPPHRVYSARVRRCRKHGSTGDDDRPS